METFQGDSCYIFTFESIKHHASPTLDFHQCFRAKEWKAVVTSKSKKRKEPDASITLCSFLFLCICYVSAAIADRAFLYSVRDCHNFSGIILDSLRCF